MISLAIMVYWIYCLINQTNEEYEEIKRSVEGEWL